VSRRAKKSSGMARDRKTAKRQKPAKPPKSAKTVKRPVAPPKARHAKPAKRPASRPVKRRAAAADPMRPTDEPIRLLAPDGRWLGKANSPPLAPELLLALFQGMLRVRLLDGRMLNLQRQGRIGFYGQCTGQEASIIGSASALEARDWVAPALREAGVAVWRGLPLARLVAQCMAKDNEVSHGRQMPCHHSFREGNFISMSSVIATQLLHATGIALAAKTRRDPIVCVGYLGDGATSEHDFHSALNFAGVWRAPVVFFCQNNQWAISVPVSRQTAAKTLAIKALSYGMPGVRVDGNDVVAVHLEMKKAVERARGGGGPTFIEALTYRRLGHSSSDDPTRYRDAGEVKKWERLDPIDRLRRHLTARGLLTKAKEEALEEEIQAAISAAITEAEAGVEPPVETLVSDVFAEPTAQLVEQRDALVAYLHSRGTDPKVESNHG
jgi:pyruvate dehydrogenase E1 component alpha subunit/2-oxoisovalerate dehydrogenase E1 component alpha subunit